MKTKNGRHLFIVLGVLLIHTLVLSFWLKDTETFQKQANIKSDGEVEEPEIQIITNSRFKTEKDSLKSIPGLFTVNFRSQLK